MNDDASSLDQRKKERTEALLDAAGENSRVNGRRDASEERALRGNGQRGAAEPASAIKMLVSATLAGSLIGKGGTQIAELQERTHARIKLSQNNDFFPGTQDRIVLISGEVDTVPLALSLVIAHLHASAKARNVVPVADASVLDNTSVKLLIAKAAGGLLIGKAGATIKSLNEETGAKVQLAPKDEPAAVVTGERVVTVSGQLECVLKAVNRIVAKLAEEPELSRYQNLTTSYSRSTSAAHPMHPAFDIPTYHTQSFNDTQLLSPAQNPPGATPRGVVGPPGVPSVPGVPAAQQPQSITLQVPDKLVGAILGRGGQTLREIQQQSSCRITISRRGEYAPGTQHRIITIDGPTYHAELAKTMVTVKVQQASVAPGAVF